MLVVYSSPPFLQITYITKTTDSIYLIKSKDVASTMPMKGLISHFPLQHCPMIARLANEAQVVMRFHKHHFSEEAQCNGWGTRLGLRRTQLILPRLQSPGNLGNIPLFIFYLKIGIKIHPLSTHCMPFLPSSHRTWYSGTTNCKKGPQQRSVKIICPKWNYLWIKRA